MRESSWAFICVWRLLARNSVVWIVAGAAEVCIKGPAVPDESAVPVVPHTCAPCAPVDATGPSRKARKLISIATEKAEVQDESSFTKQIQSSSLQTARQCSSEGGVNQARGSSRCKLCRILRCAKSSQAVAPSVMVSPHGRETITESASQAVSEGVTGCCRRWVCFSPHGREATSGCASEAVHQGVAGLLQADADVQAESLRAEAAAAAQEGEQRVAALRAEQKGGAGAELPARVRVRVRVTLRATCCSACSPQPMPSDQGIRIWRCKEATAFPTPVVQARARRVCAAADTHAHQDWGQGASAPLHTSEAVVNASRVC